MQVILLSALITLCYFPICCLFYIVYFTRSRFVIKFAAWSRQMSSDMTCAFNINLKCNGMSTAYNGTNAINFTFNYLNSRPLPSKTKTFVSHLYNVGSKFSVQYRTNVIQMFCAYWFATKASDDDLGGSAVFEEVFKSMSMLL